jgi:hypothetical protein
MDSTVTAGIPSVQRLARVAGLLYLVLVVCGMFSPIVLERLVVPDDAATTAYNIQRSPSLFGVSLVSWVVIVVADIVISVAFYLLLEPVNRALSLVAAAFRLVYSAMLGATLFNLYEAFLLLTDVERGASLEAQQAHAMALSALNSFSAGFLLALIVFGVHVSVLGFLLYQSRYVPRVLSVVLIAAGVGYILNSLADFFVPSHAGLATAILLAPAVLGEFGLTAWLLVKGVKVRKRASSETD